MLTICSQSWNKKSGAFNLDKVGDAIKEMSIRVVDGSEQPAR